VQQRIADLKQSLSTTIVATVKSARNKGCNVSETPAHETAAAE
jgi:hypothetical protein